MASIIHHSSRLVKATALLALFEPRSVWISAVVTVRRIEIKKVQDKKSQKCYISISRILGINLPLPAKPICTKIFMWGDVPDIIRCAKSQNKIMRGCDSTWDRNLDFPIEFFCMGLITMHRQCAIACDWVQCGNYTDLFTFQWVC